MLRCYSPFLDSTINYNRSIGLRQSIILFNISGQIVFLFCAGSGGSVVVIYKLSVLWLSRRTPSNFIEAIWSFPSRNGEGRTWIWKQREFQTKGSGCAVVPKKNGQWVGENEMRRTYQLLWLSAAEKLEKLENLRPEMVLILQHLSHYSHAQRNDEENSAPDSYVSPQICQIQ